MSNDLRTRLFDELSRLELVDPHTHINPRAPAASTLADILGYHYYTELAHSAGMEKAAIEEPGLDPQEKTRRLVQFLPRIDNTIQYSWLLEMARELFGFEHERLTSENWEELYESSLVCMAKPDWPRQVLAKSRISSLFLTNDFDDPLEGFDTKVYVPCLRTDELVFHLAKSEVRRRLERASGVSVGGAGSLRAALGRLFDFFTSRGARACAISLPPTFSPSRVETRSADAAISALWTGGPSATAAHRRDVSYFVFWTLTELCAEYKLPFDLMIGVNRGVYPGGMHQGQDLFDGRVSLIQYQELFCGFPQVVFPVSVLASSLNQELVAYSWIFPNVVTCGHWWYSNTPAYIEQDCAARLEAVPHTKQIGYYSDMYKLEFALPKFAMYRRVLAKVLAERFVIDRRWSEARALELGRRVLVDNVASVFGAG